MNPEMQAFVNGYIECALSSSNDVSDDDPNHRYESLRGMELDDKARFILTVHAATFYWQHYALLHSAIEACGQDWEHAGHDLWLTHNGHGAGFWDGDWNQLSPSDGVWYGTLLTVEAKKYKEIDLYVADYDKKVYV